MAKLNKSAHTFSKVAIVELTLAGALWGFGFISAVWALRDFGPSTTTALRFFLACLVGFGIAMLRPQLRESLTWDQFRLAFPPAVWLSIVLILQTWGLKFTTATKSGFITTLYVLIVPFLEHVWLKQKLPRFHLFYAAVALLGVGLISDLASGLRATLGTEGLETSFSPGWNWGDTLTLFCAVAASLHILWFGKIQDQIRSSFVFNLHQSAWAALITIPIALATESWPTQITTTLSLVGIGALAFGSTLIAFALQIKAQKEVSPSLASLLFLLESPFTTLFAIYFLAESLRTEQWVGAGLILAAVILSTLWNKEASEGSEAT